MPAVEGPLLRWISKAEEEKFKVQVEVTPPQPPTPIISSYSSYLNSYPYYSQLYQLFAAQSTTSTSKTASQSGSDSQPTAAQSSTPQVTTALANSSSVPSTSTPATSTTPSTTNQTAAATFSTFRLPSAPATYPFGYYTPVSASTAPGGTTNSAFQSSIFTPTTIPPTPQPAQKQYVEEERTEKVTKNYVVHELGQWDGVTKPPWKDMMKAMFGDHIKWEELKVLSGKGRPLSKSATVHLAGWSAKCFLWLGRVKQRCPITGQIAPYLDPRTGVPFADVEAFKVLSDILEHHYVWSPELGCYVGRDEEG